MADFAQIIKNAFNMAVPYTVPHMSQFTDDPVYLQEMCESSCLNTAILIASIFGKGAFVEPGIANPGEPITSLVDEVMQTEIVLHIGYPKANHNMCAIIKDNICYLCESLQSQYGLNVFVLPKFDLIRVILDYKYEHGHGCMRIGKYELDLNVHTAVNRFRHSEYTRSEKDAIKKFTKSKKKFAPEVFNMI